MKRNIYNKVIGCVVLATMLSGCYDDGVEGDSYYVFQGQTVVGQLQSSLVRRRLTEHMSEKEVENQMVK